MADTKKDETTKKDEAAAKRDEGTQTRENTEIKPREAKAVGPSRIDDPARTEAPTGARVNLPEKEARRADRPEDGDPVPVGSPGTKGKTYTYRVVERAFKENMLLDPSAMPEGSGGLFQSAELYNSRALVPADDATQAAVDKMKDEHDHLRNKAAPISRDESAELRQRIAELEAAAKGNRSTTAPARVDEDEKGDKGAGTKKS
ncbi:MAG TPA: hypothetical protein VGI97_00630 [Gemmatimonadaceae bacterium]|jgi:hypothetical protein